MIVRFKTSPAVVAAAIVSAVLLGQVSAADSEATTIEATPGSLPPSEYYIPASASYVPAAGSEMMIAADAGTDEGTVRITDQPDAFYGDPAYSGQMRGRPCPHCQTCPHGFTYDECPECEVTRAHLRRYRRRCGVTFPPNYGWAAPGVTPIHRVSVDYTHYFPHCWSGHPGGPAVPRPMVYHPTDTTQLGYTYQHVPRWLPYPGMAPPVPLPRDWHVPLTDYCGRGGIRGSHAGYCPPGAGGVPVGTPASEEGTPSPPEEESTPVSEPTDIATLPSGPDLNYAPMLPPLMPVPN